MKYQMVPFRVSDYSKLYERKFFSINDHSTLIFNLIAFTKIKPKCEG